MRRLWRFVVGLLAVVGFLGLLLLAGSAFLLHALLSRPVRLPERIVLTADWRGGLSEVRRTPDLLQLERTPPLTVTDTVLALEAAGRDPRIAGLVVRLDGSRSGFAAAQELRGAVQRFRARGKFALAHADSFGELTPGNEGYYLATAFDEIHLQPVGFVGLTGLMAEVPLAQELLARLGIELEVARRAEYKTALDSLTERELPPANREMLNALLDSLSGQLVQGIAEGRKLAPARVRALIDRGPFTGEEALKAGLIDRLGHQDETLAAAGVRAGRGGGPLALADYARIVEEAGDGAATVALIRAAGLIRRGEGGIGQEIAADDLAETLAEVAEDDAVRAVILRIDSGGGSAVASETIARGVRRVLAADKPVIVSMGNAAASGGYWIAMDATRIVAQPGTLTGSIGVVAGKPDLDQLWARLGVNWAQLTRGQNAAIWSVNGPYAPEARARLEAILDAIYGAFKAGVAAARDLPPERVDAIAKGRVWDGATAKELGLVDELGGLGEALAAARRELGLGPDVPLAIEPMPRPKNPLVELLAWWGSQAAILARLDAIWRSPLPATAPPKMN